jgi:F0F1-type ATP synthase membrane subunit c/vacuolar-type H+-ATPase subunit K
MANEPSPASLETQRRTSRIIAFALWLAVWVYAFIYVFQILKGDPRGFLAPLAAAPWGNPVLVVLCALAALVTAPALLLRHTLLERAAKAHDAALRCGLERTGMIVSMAIFESIAIYGLVLGFVLGPATAPVSALLFLVPLVVNPFLLPPHARFRGGDDAGIRPS